MKSFVTKHVFSMLSACALALALAFAAHGALRIHGNDLVFRLCSGDIAHVTSTAVSGGIQINFSLTDAATKRFAEFTRKFQGRVLVVTAGDIILSRSVIQAAVTSGRFVTNVLSETETSQLKAALRSGGGSSPCGASLSAHLPNIALQPATLTAGAVKVPSAAFSRSGGG